MQYDIKKLERMTSEELREVAGSLGLKPRKSHTDKMIIYSILDAQADKKAAAAKALLAQEVETNKAKAAEVAKKRQEAADALAAAAVEAAQEAAAAEAEVAAE